MRLFLGFCSSRNSIDSGSWRDNHDPVPRSKSSPIEQKRVPTQLSLRFLGPLRLSMAIRGLSMAAYLQWSTETRFRGEKPEVGLVAVAVLVSKPDGAFVAKNDQRFWSSSIETFTRW